MSVELCVAIDALKTARSVILIERRSQYESFTMPPHKNDAATFAQMNSTERYWIKKFDRAIDKIETAMKMMRGTISKVNVPTRRKIK